MGHLWQHLERLLTESPEIDTADSAKAFKPRRSHRGNQRLTTAGTTGGSMGQGVRILKLDREDESKKIDFELAYLRSLTIQERFKMMFAKNREIQKLLQKDESRKAFRIIKRT